MDRHALIDQRITTLLSSTDMTFKQIIEQLRSENMPASFNTIRRVNRNHRFRKPRYDAKLTPLQRKELIVILKKTTKPNLSALARQFGVCHGSIWYWWDKLSKLREKHNGIIPNNEPSLEIDDMDQDFFQTGSISSNDTEGFYPNEHGLPSAEYTYGNNMITCNENDDGDEGLIADPESDPLDLSGDNQSYLCNTTHDVPLDFSREPEYSPSAIGDTKSLKLVGRVQAKSIRGPYIKLPILMFTSITSNNGCNSRGSNSGCSSSSNSTGTSSSIQTSSSEQVP